MGPASPLRALVAAGPGRPGVAETLARVDPGASLLLTGDGLSWLADRAFLAACERQGVSIAICSRSGRDRKVDPAALPPRVRWSSLTTWFSELPPGAPFWALFP